MTSSTPSPARLEELEKIAREAPAGLTAPSWSGDGQGYIWGKSIKGGQTVIAQVRGWGYLTGKGHGALRLSEEEAIAIQGAWERHIAAFDPPQCLELLALIRAQAERIAELEGRGEAAAGDGRGDIERLRTVLRFVADHITHRDGFEKPDPVFLRSMILAALTQPTASKEQEERS